MRGMGRAIKTRGFSGSASENKRPLNSDSLQSAELKIEFLQGAAKKKKVASFHFPSRFGASICLNGPSTNCDDENCSLRMRHLLEPAFLPADRIPRAFSESKSHWLEKPAEHGYLEDNHSRKEVMLLATASVFANPCPPQNLGMFVTKGGRKEHRRRGGAGLKSVWS